MKNTILKYGLIAGLIVAALMGITAGVYVHNPDFDLGMVFGYAGMLVAYTFVFLGVKNYRDKQNGGFITFGKAFKVGMLMSLLTATVYVGTWMIEHHYIFPDFMEKYVENSIVKLEKEGLPQTEFQAKKEEFLYYKELYKNPLWIILFTYMEIMVPIGLLAPVITAAILKRKPTAEAQV
jgi:amino acid transporter